MKNIVIIGAGDFGKEVAWLIEDINRNELKYNILGFLDDDEKKIGRIFNGYKCLGPVSFLDEIAKDQLVCAVIAMQDGKIRRYIVEKLAKFKNWETIIHPSVNFSPTSVIEKGCIVCAGSNISVNTVIKEQCIFNFSVTVGHDCIIEKFVSIMSGSCVSGHTVIKEGAYLSTNSTVIPGMCIGNNAKVGAGSVVIRNVKDGTTVMGVPAKRLNIL